jgi:hypothetical protein
LARRGRPELRRPVEEGDHPVGHVAELEVLLHAPAGALAELPAAGRIGEQSTEGASQIGRIASRNSCQGPWVSSSNLTLSLNPTRLRLPQRIRPRRCSRIRPTMASTAISADRSTPTRRG